MNAHVPPPSSIEDDIQVEAQHGLPEMLPGNERILWQGRPDWRAVAIDVFHARAIVVYGAVLVAWRVITTLHDGGTFAEAALVGAWLALLPVAALPILAGLAYATAASTVYTITNRRVVMRIGVALTVTLNLPFARIAEASYKPGWFGTGDLPLSLAGSDRIAFAVLWPHSKPWQVRRPQPMLRGVPNGAKVAQVLASALAAANVQPARNVASIASAPAPAGAPVAA